MSLSHTYDTSRSEITAAMEQRIEKGDRTKLTHSINCLGNLY